MDKLAGGDNYPTACIVSESRSFTNLIEPSFKQHSRWEFSSQNVGADMLKISVAKLKHDASMPVPTSFTMMQLALVSLLQMYLSWPIKNDSANLRLDMLQ